MTAEREVRADLHVHSRCSDGTGTPGDVVAEAAAAGLNVIALTDHDTTQGWAEAVDAAHRHGIALLRGAEVSTRRGSLSVHILSYLHDPAHPGLTAEFDKSRRSRATRAQRMVESVAQEYDLSWADVKAQVTPGATLGRPHIADALVAKGHFDTRDEVFGHVLGNGSRHYVGYYCADPVDAIRLILDAGGVPVLAHPLATARGRTLTTEGIVELIDAGLAGIEAYHRDNDPDRRDWLAQLARDHGLIVTGSSDYHGTGKPNRLGEFTTAAPQVRRIAEAGSTPVIDPAGVLG